MAGHPPFTIAHAHAAADIAAVRRLFMQYADSLGIDLAFQGFQTELDTLPGRYAPPAGTLLLARDADGGATGCVGLRGIEPAGCCEMKRLFVPPAGRGLGVGLALIRMVIAAATALGYREIRLDTLPSMTAAVALYRREGFAPIAPYYPTPVAGTVFLSRPLSA